MLLPVLAAAPVLLSALLAQPASATSPSSSSDAASIVLDSLVDNVGTLQERVVGALEESSAHELADRATVYCTATTDCTAVGYAIPANSHYACNKARGVCTWGCNQNYVASGLTCVRVTSSTTTSPAASSTPVGPKAPNPTPVLKRNYAGAGFFDLFNFWDQPDPTHGSVTYVSRETAKALNLTTVSSAGTAIISIDRKSRLALGQPRNSVRIESKELYQPGNLIILDLKKAPSGPSTWPAFWMYNYPWPESGEIDVYEGVNWRTFNQYTLHSSPGCTRSSNIPMTGVTNGVDPNCNAGNGGLGCTVYDYDPTSYGREFNRVGGGVFAVLFAETGISIWRWQRANVPGDVQSGAPRWKTWGTPVAAFDGSTCDTRTFFRNQKLTFDITTCGDWAGNQYVWQDGDASGPVYPKYSTCASANSDPLAFRDAYFEVNYLKVFGV
ncbi:hypothetical protein JCM8208_003760 [Rhodotorula glutinis]